MGWVGEGGAGGLGRYTGSLHSGRHQSRIYAEDLRDGHLSALLLGGRCCDAGHGLLDERRLRRRQLAGR